MFLPKGEYQGGHRGKTLFHIRSRHGIARSDGVFLSPNNNEVPQLCCGACCLVSVAFGPPVVPTNHILLTSGKHRHSSVGALFYCGTAPLLFCFVLISGGGKVDPVERSSALIGTLGWCRLTRIVSFRRPWVVP